MVNMAQPKSSFFDTATTLGKVISFFGISALCGALAAGLMLPLGMLGGAAATTGSDLLDELPTELQEEPMSEPSRILASDGSTIATFYAEDRTPVELDDISDYMKDAIVSVEDERFYDHSGVDPRGLGRAMFNNATSGSEQGASTLTQQYVNNVLVNYQHLNGLRTTVSGQKNMADKVREMKLAVNVEEEMTKDEILEGYLNIVLFTGRTYGVESAARYFFDKHAADLTLDESALLAGMVQSPNALDPTNPDNVEASKNRRNVVLGTMLENDYIEQDEYDEAVAKDIELDVNRLSSGCSSAGNGSGYFCDYVQRQILNDQAFGPDRDARQRLLDRGGLEIQTTLDPELQELASEQARDSVPNDESDGVGSSLVTVEQNTGNIRAMAQNTDYSVDGEAKGASALNFNVDREDGGGNGFQGGSTLKPFVALAWIGAGNSMRDNVDASRDDYSEAKFPAYCLDKGYTRPDTWSVNNAIGDMKKTMRADYGLYWSINTATVAMAYETDLCQITDLTTAAGIHGAADQEPLNPQDPSFILGAQEVAPMTMASAYSTLGSGGTYCEPRAIEEVTDAAGNSYEVPPEQCDTDAINSEHIDELNNTLTGIAEDRTDEDDEIDFPIAGKTGTNNNESSTWFVGYTSELTTTAWVGRYTSQETLTGETIGGVYFDDVWGSIIAGPMWVDYMKEGGQLYETNDFPEFDGRSGDPAKK